MSWSSLRSQIGRFRIICTFLMRWARQTQQLYRKPPIFSLPRIFKLIQNTKWFKISLFCKRKRRKILTNYYWINRVNFSRSKCLVILICWNRGTAIRAWRCINNIKSPKTLNLIILTKQAVFSAELQMCQLRTSCLLPRQLEVWSIWGMSRILISRSSPI